MDLLVVGLSHRTAPLELRERVTFSEEEAREVLGRARCDGTLSEALLLSTCNRTELYGVSADNGAAERYIRALVETTKRVALGPTHTYTLTEAESARHLFRVAAGLESMVLGEAQILGQVKQAHRLALASRSCGVVLDRLLSAAITVGKRVRTETKLGGGAVSVASAAAELAGKIFEDLSGRRVLLVGVGEMGALTARHMMERGARRLTIANRTFSRAEALARELGGRPLPLDRLGEALVEADIVISSTGAAEPIVTVDQMKPILHRRAGRPIYIIDIAVPRDFDRAVGDLDGVFLHDQDDIGTLVERNIEKRRREIPKAEAIVEQELEAFLHWRRSLAATPLIKALREKLDAVAARELARHRKRFAPEDREQLERFTESLLGKILHPLTARVRTWTTDDPLGTLRLDSLYDAFDLPRDEKDAAGGADEG